MGRAWYDASEKSRAVFAQANRILGNRLGQSIEELCFSGPPERLNQTDVSQPAIYVTSIACWRGLLARRGDGVSDHPPAATAGLSLGEYTALHIAGALTFEDGLELVTLRGRAMQDAADDVGASGGSKGGMVAIIGASDEQAAAIADEARASDVLVCANFNAPGQVVLSGHVAACERAVTVASAGGFRATLLAVAGAFHSPLMAPAAQRLHDALVQTPFSPLQCEVISNVTALPHAKTEVANVRQLLVDQLTCPVQWARTCAYLAAKATTGGGETSAENAFEFIELAPGKTLMGLMRRIDKGIKVTSHDSP